MAPAAVQAAGRAAPGAAAPVPAAGRRGPGSAGGGGVGVRLGSRRPGRGWRCTRACRPPASCLGRWPSGPALESRGGGHGACAVLCWWNKGYFATLAIVFWLAAVSERLLLQWWREAGSVDGMDARQLTGGRASLLERGRSWKSGQPQPVGSRARVGGWADCSALGTREVRCRGTPMSLHPSPNTPTQTPNSPTRPQEDSQPLAGSQPACLLGCAQHPRPAEAAGRAPSHTTM